MPNQRKRNAQTVCRGAHDAACIACTFAARINAFTHTFDGLDDSVMVYTCTDAIIFAIAGGVVALALIALTASFFILSRKEKRG